MLTGKMIIGSAQVLGTATTFRATNPATGAELEPAFGGGGKEDLSEEVFGAASVDSTGGYEMGLYFLAACAILSAFLAMVTAPSRKVSDAAKMAAAA